MWPAILHIQIRAIKTATACLRVYERVSERDRNDWALPTHSTVNVVNKTPPATTTSMTGLDLLRAALNLEVQHGLWCPGRTQPSNQPRPPSCTWPTILKPVEVGTTQQPIREEGRGKRPWPKTWPEVATFPGTLVAAGSAGDSSQFSTKVSERGHKNHVSVPACQQRNVHRQFLRQAGKKKNTKYKWRLDETSVSSLIFVLRQHLIKRRQRHEETSWAPAMEKKLFSLRESFNSKTSSSCHE